MEWGSHAPVAHFMCLFWRPTLSTHLELPLFDFMLRNLLLTPIHFLKIYLNWHTVLHEFQVFSMLIAYFYVLQNGHLDNSLLDRRYEEEINRRTVAENEFVVLKKVRGQGYSLLMPRPR